MQENTAERKAELSRLESFYGEMLTDKERLAADLYLGEDLSLAEIAAEMSVSRQGAHDTLNRAFQKLAESESKLGLAERFCGLEGDLAGLKRLLAQVQPVPETQMIYRQALDLLNDIITRLEQ